jgi:hypothetical protein
MRDVSDASFAAAALGDHRDLVERRVLARTPTERLAERPAAHLNSLVFTLWHVARVEDVALNVVLAGRGEVRTEGRWRDRLGLDEPRVGTAFTSQGVDDFGRAVSSAGVIDYWRAVRTATLEWIGGAPGDGRGIAAPDGLDQRLDGVFPWIAPAASWLQQYWRGRPAEFFLRMPVVNHGFIHYGEMITIQSALGIEAR